MIRNSNDENNLLHKLLLINTQVSKICKVFANGSSGKIKFSKTQLSKIVQSRGLILSSPNTIGSGILFDIFTKSVEGLYSFVKSTSKNKSGKNLNEYDPVDTELSLFGKKFKKGITTLIGSGITLKANEIKDIMKVIKP